MSGKLINTLKYGSSRTKRKIYLMFGILAVGVTLAVVALVMGNELLGLGAFVVIFVDGMILFNTSFEKKEVSVPHREKKKKEQDGPGALEWISAEKKVKKEETEKITETDELEKIEELEEITELDEVNPLLQYDQQKLKKIMVAYKVKKYHVLAMIDSSQSGAISECPAYLWKDSSYLYFLLLEKEPRMFKSKIQDSSEIRIRLGVPAKPLEEYKDMEAPSLVSMLFGNLLPKYYKLENTPYRLDYRKNLYSAAPGIWCTPASVKNLLKLLPENFVLDDGRHSEESRYYQEIYIARLMYWDGIYSGEEYKEKVLEVLANLVNSELAENVIMEYLTRMMQKSLIPREYADYALSKRKNR